MTQLVAVLVVRNFDPDEACDLRPLKFIMYTILRMDRPAQSALRPQ